MDQLECLMGRRSTRKFTGEPIDDATLEKLLRAGMAAPSAGNQQPWRFIVLRDRDMRVKVAGCSPYANMLPDAAVGIVVCGETVGERHAGYWVQDCSAATENILLAACALGLGGVWLGFYPNEARSECAKEVLGLPETVQPLAVIAIGHPAEVKEPVDRFDAEFVHENRW
jgi:nitroreductase